MKTKYAHIEFRLKDDDKWHCFAQAGNEIGHFDYYNKEFYFLPQSNLYLGEKSIRDIAHFMSQLKKP